MADPPGVEEAVSQADEFARRAASAIGPSSIGGYSACAGADITAEAKGGGETVSAGPAARKTGT